MPNPNRTDATTPATAAAAPLSWMTGLNCSAMETFARGSEAFAKALQEWQQELSRFTTARLQRDSELGQKLLGCHDWSEAMKLQQEWLSAMGQDYFEEGNRLLQLVQKVGGDLTNGAANAGPRQAA